MPQLDLFTLLFQFKSFFFSFLIIYLIFIVFLLPKIHKILWVRRTKFLKWWFLVISVERLRKFFYVKQCLFYKRIISESNLLFELFFIEYNNLLFNFNKLSKLLKKFYKNK